MSDLIKLVARVGGKWLKTKPAVVLAIGAVVVVVYLAQGGTVTVEQAADLLDVVEEVTESVEVVEAEDVELEGTGEGVVE